MNQAVEYLQRKFFAFIMADIGNEHIHGGFGESVVFYVSGQEGVSAGAGGGGDEGGA